MVHSHSVLPLWRRLLPWALLAGAIAVTFAAAASVVALRQRADDDRLAAHMFTQLDGDMQRLSALKWEAIAQQSIGTDLGERISDVAGEMEDTLTEVERLEGTSKFVRLRPLIEDYRESVVAVTELLSSGRRSEAVALDERRLAPAFERLAALLAADKRSHDEAAARANDRANLVSLVALVAAVALVGALLWAFQQARMRSRRSQAESARLRELDSMKDAFISTVSHELRSPLTSIQGYLELLLEEEEGQLTDEQRHFLEVVRRNAERLLRVVEDLLFLSRVDAGKLQVAHEQVDLAGVVRESMEALTPRARNRGIDLVLDSGTALMLGDPARLAQVADNLISNAIKFTQDGGHVSVEVGRTDDHVRLVVADTGIGIPAAELDRLFERFFRTSTASQLAIQGTGLGLAIVRAIIESHDGVIQLESEQGVGTTVRITFPALQPAERQEAPHIDEIVRG